MEKKGVSAFGVLLVLAGFVGIPPVSGEDNTVNTGPVVVTATRIEEKVSEQASSVSVVPRETIELKAPSLAGDVLRGLPGVDVQRSGSPGSLENIRIRGGLAAGTLVLIDGFPVNSPTLGQFDIGSLPVSSFERVEVVRGAQSALYGSNAMSGVVNFLPPSPGNGRRYGLSVFGGSHNTLQWSGSAEGGGKGGSYHLGGAGTESDGFLANDDLSLASFLGGGEAPVGGRSRVHVLVMGTDEDKGIPVDFGTRRDENHRLLRRGRLAGIRWETRVSPSLSITASGSQYDEIFHEKDPADPGESLPYVFEADTKTRKSVLGVLARMTGGSRSETFLGVEFTRDRATNATRSNYGDTDIAGTNINRSLYLQEEWRPWKGTGLSAGVRVDRNTDAGTEVNPRVAAYRELGNTGVRLRAAAGRGFRTPTISEKADPTLGNPALSPESAVSLEAGADAVLAGGDAGVSAVWFHQSFRNLIQYDSSVPGPVGFGQLRNSGRAFSRGIETTASWRFLPGAETELSYTYTDSWDSSYGRRLRGVPPHRGDASLILVPADGFTCRADWHVESFQLDAPPNGEDIRRPGYARLDLYGEYRWRTGSGDIREVALQGKVQNLLDRRYEERRGYPAPGIHFLLGVKLAI